MRTVNPPAYLAALKREIDEMSDEETERYAEEAMDSDRAFLSLLTVIEMKDTD